jgi:hypothetical protein
LAGWGLLGGPFGQRREIGTMSGSGTNIGVEYQQKVSAWFVLQMYLKHDTTKFLRGLPGPFHVAEIRFESEAPIDDLNVICDEGGLFIQIKHTLSFSDGIESEFVSVIDQFVRQHLLAETNQKYLLVTSSKSSRRVRTELNKILDSIRLNTASYFTNPTTISEAEVFNQYRGIVARLAEQHGVSPDGLFNELSKRMHVLTFDLDEGQALDIATLMQVANYSDVSPRLVWSNLIAKSLELASRRQTLSRDGAIMLFNRLFVRNQPPETVLEGLPDWFQIHKNPEGLQFASGVEYIFARATENNLDGKYCILELYRFDEHGNERFSFSDGILRLSNGLEFKLIYRCSTFVRLETLLGEWIKSNPANEIVYLAGNFDKDAENSSVFAKAHSEILEKSVATRLKQLVCLHCTEFIAERDVISIESEESRVPVVRYVHKACLQGSDRIIGHIPIGAYDAHSELRMFNFESWATTLINSMHTVAAAGQVTDSAIILWDEHYTEPRGEFCFAYMLSDGSKEYVHTRSRIERSSATGLSANKKILEDLIAKGKADNDPFCYTSINRRFGKYSLLLKLREEGEKILEIVELVVERYNLSIKNNYEKAENYYAPVFYVESLTDNLPLQLGQYFVLLTDPFEFGFHKDNWQRFGVSIEDYRLVIVENDLSFDKLLSEIFASGLQPILDPLLRSTSDISKGTVIDRLSSFA